MMLLFHYNQIIFWAGLPAQIDAKACNVRFLSKFIANKAKRHYCERVKKTKYSCCGLFAFSAGGLSVQGFILITLTNLPTLTGVGGEQENIMHELKRGFTYTACLFECGWATGSVPDCFCTWLMCSKLSEEADSLRVFPPSAPISAVSQDPHPGLELCCSCQL